MRQKIRYFVQYYGKTPAQLNIARPDRQETGFVDITGYTTRDWNNFTSGYDLDECEARTVRDLDDEFHTRSREITCCEAKKLLKHHPHFAELRFPRYLDEVV